MTDWDQIRNRYYAGTASLRTLATEFKVCLRTLERRASKEGWVKQRQNLVGVVSASAVTAAKKQGEAHALSATELIRRSLKGAALILDKVESELSRPTPDAAALRALVSSWRDAVTIGRLTHGLDQPVQERALVKISNLNIAFARERPGPVVIPVTTTTANKPKHEPTIDIPTGPHTGGPADSAAADNSA